MEIDTGAAAIIIREDTFKEIGQVKLEVKLNPLAWNWKVIQVNQLKY